MSLGETMGGWPDSAHVFIDESKARDYTIVAATLAPAAVTDTRSAVRSLRHKGSPSIHMRKESPSTKSKIIQGFKGLRLSTYILRCDEPGLSELERRTRCLDRLLDLCAQEHASRLTIERDESLFHWERQYFVEAVRQRQMRDNFEYTWRNRNEEPLLWVPDAVAWSYAKGGKYRADIQPLVCGSEAV